MQVLIMRHGDALQAAASDPARPLSEQGISETEKMAHWLQKQHSVIDIVLVSPYVRAQQTLEKLSKIIELPPAETLNLLTPGADPVRVNQYLQELAFSGASSVLIISHLPLVGYLVSELCPQEVPPMFATAAVAQIMLDTLRGTGKLVSLVAPSNLWMP